MSQNDNKVTSLCKHREQMETDRLFLETLDRHIAEDPDYISLIPEETCKRMECMKRKLAKARETQKSKNN